MPACAKTLSTLGLIAMTVVALPTVALADDGRFDWLEGRIDRAENRRDEAVDHGRLDVIEDRIDRAEDRADAAGLDRYDVIDRHERRTWRRAVKSE